MNPETTVGQILVAIANFLPELEAPWQHDREKLSRFFEEQKKMHPSLLEKISFRQRDIFPESPELDEAFSNLVSAGLIYSKGTNFNPHHFSGGCLFAYERFVMNRLTPEEMAEVAEISRDFYSSFCI